MTINVAIAGNPNCGKTTLFNCLAGTNYSVANYPGVTVEKKFAKIKFQGSDIVLTDLPGTYSLTAYSLEETVARDLLTGEKPDIVVHVVDASNLERNLYLLIQLLELDLPVILALNMVDVAVQRGIIIDSKALSSKLGIPVIETVARKGSGKKSLLSEIVNFKADSSEKKYSLKDFSYGDDVDVFLDKMESSIQQSNFLQGSYIPRWVALKYLESDDQILSFGACFDNTTHKELIKYTQTLTKHINTTHDTYPEAIISDYRYGHVASVLKNVVTGAGNNIDRVFLSEKIDKILTNRLIGPLIMMLVLYFTYQFTFWAGEYPLQMSEHFFQWLSNSINSLLPDGMLKSLIVSGIIQGVGGVLGFVPLIFLMFCTISILEDSGYMARVAYMLDKIFKFFGLNGSSALSYLISGGIAGGCAVPGIMATRAIKGKSERVITILTTSFMVCGAKLPIFALLISAFFEGNKGLLLLVITLVSWIIALVIAKALSTFFFKGESSSFIMELPPYRFPTLKGILLHSWNRSWMYIKKAGTIILLFSVVIWVLMNFPRLPGDNNNFQTEAGLRHSVAGRVGTFLEPVTRYAGFDWRTNIALIAGISGKELIVSTLGIAHSLGDSTENEGSASLSKKLKASKDWDRSVAIAMILFVIIYMPCLASVVVIAKEAGSWWWSGFASLGYLILAFFAAVIGYNFF